MKLYEVRIPYTGPDKIEIENDFTRRIPTGIGFITKGNFVPFQLNNWSTIQSEYSKDDLWIK